MEQQLKNIAIAAKRLLLLTAEDRSNYLSQFAILLKKHTPLLLEANQKDLSTAGSSLTPSLLGRLKLDEDKITQLADGISSLASRKDPLSQIISSTLLDDGLILNKVSTPIGVLAVVFESRPDVIPQILSLALRTGNAVILKGGKEAIHSNRTFIELIKTLNHTNPHFPADWATLLETREEFGSLLDFPQYIDLVIPRGSNALVKSIMERSRIPVMGHADGVCHLYLDSSYLKAPLDTKKAIEIIIDSKIQYPTACNALETLLIDHNIAKEFIEEFYPIAKSLGVQVLGCNLTKKFIPDCSSVIDWSTEYGDNRLAVKITSSVEEAISHINTFGSHHTDTILAEDDEVIKRFMLAVDSACVFSNCSTRFSDGYRFGFGAEVGISTGKLHARGPVGVEGLLSYKYLLRGSGQKVAEYVGATAKQFLHKSVELKES
jgi:glutamate-5-semialdehyde dehydrogenase